jgi:hypothetical protein
MSVHDLQYRPLRAGTSIMNGRMREPGTLGFIGHDAAGAAWIVSCYHVLCDTGLGLYVSDDAVFQPAAAAAENRVAVTSRTKADAALDCAAAKIDPGIAVTNAMLGIGDLAGVNAAAVGMRVVKSGGESGITEGVVTAVSATQISVRVDPTFPLTYELSAPGDSGSAWLEQGTRKVVALHRGLQTPKQAVAVAIQAVLASLQLVLLA